MYKATGDVDHAYHVSNYARCYNYVRLEVTCGCNVTVTPLRPGNAYVPGLFAPPSWSPLADFAPWCARAPPSCARPRLAAPPLPPPSTRPPTPSPTHSPGQLVASASEATTLDQYFALAKNLITDALWSTTGPVESFGPSSPTGSGEVLLKSGNTTLHYRIIDVSSCQGGARARASSRRAATPTRPCPATHPPNNHPPLPPRSARPCPTPRLRSCSSARACPSPAPTASAAPPAPLPSCWSAPSGTPACSTPRVWATTPSPAPTALPRTAWASARAWSAARATPRVRLPTTSACPAGRERTLRTARPSARPAPPPSSPPCLAAWTSARCAHNSWPTLPLAPARLCPAPHAGCPPPTHASLHPALLIPGQGPGLQAARRPDKLCLPQLLRRPARPDPGARLQPPCRRGIRGAHQHRLLRRVGWAALHGAAAGASFAYSHLPPPTPRSRAVTITPLDDPNCSSPAGANFGAVVSQGFMHSDSTMLARMADPYGYIDVDKQ